MRDRNIVTGLHGDELVFIPANRARDIARTWKAMLKAQTWKALKKFAPPEAYREILAFQESPRSIRGWHPFDYDTMTPVADGDYPGWPEQEVEEWMPSDIWQLFGRRMSTAINGDYLSFDPADAQKIVANLKQHGYRCRRNQRLIDAAHGN